MRKETIFNIGGKDYTFCLTIGAFVPMEKELGQSLLSLLNPSEGKFTEAMTVEHMKTILKYGLKGIDKDDDKVYELMEQFIADGGTLDTLAGKILEAVLLKSDFFIPSEIRKTMDKANG